MKRILMASVAMSVAPVAFNETAEVVLIKGGKDGPVRVNKADFDADQAEGGAKSMTLHKADEPEQSVASGPQVQTFENLGVPPVAAPSAPDFSGGGETAPLPIDPTKNAVAPSVPSPGQKLVSKEGKKFFVVDGTGAKVTGVDGIDEAGYGKEQDAWAAIMALPH